MSVRNGGGPAFARAGTFHPNGAVQLQSQTGMSTRAYIATAVLSGVAADPEANMTKEQMVEYAVDCADLLILALGL